MQQGSGTPVSGAAGSGAKGGTADLGLGTSSLGQPENTEASVSSKCANTGKGKGVVHSEGPNAQRSKQARARHESEDRKAEADRDRSSGLPEVASASQQAVGQQAAS